MLHCIARIDNPRLMNANTRNLLGIALILLVVHYHATAQPKVRKLSTIINHPSLNLHAPFISADANVIVFISDNAEDYALTPFYSMRSRADWSSPKPLPRNVHSRLNFLRGYGLNADGTALYVSTIKGPGVGGYDLWMSEWRGAWANPVNLGAPINSRAHEACPSLTPDGKTMYFMRCESMNQMDAGKCKIMRVDKKPNGQWGEPEELPAHINTGNSQTPRIMADGETLIFSSDAISPSKGGMDLYLTRLREGEWSQPVPLDFVNTEKNDQYVSVAALGRYLIRDTKGERNYQLVEYLIPEALRPKGLTKIEGRVVDENGSPMMGYVSLVDVDTGERVYNGRAERDGTFMLYAAEGSRYELAVDPEFADRTYFLQRLDLTTEPLPQVERVHAVIRPLIPGDSIALDNVRFVDYDTALDTHHGSSELQRLTRLINGNPLLTFRIEVQFEGYRTDSVRSDPDLTEVRVDSVWWKYVDIDTLGQLYERDTLSARYTYHNDRTAAQARAVAAYLVSNGIPTERLSTLGKAIPSSTPGTRRTRVVVHALKTERY